MSEYRDSNVTLGMVPHKKSCRCLDCENERLRKELAAAKLDIGTAWLSQVDWQQRAESAEAELAAANARAEKAERDLAECFRQSGADTDGDEDWRIAKDAVQEVTRMREDWDKCEDDCSTLREKVKVLKDYVRHKQDCNRTHYHDERVICTCGLSEAVAEPKERG